MQKAPNTKSLKPVARLRQLPLRRAPRRLLASVAIATVVVLAPLLAFSETTLKALLDRWLSQCIVVIDLFQEQNAAPLAIVYTFGDLPKSLPLTFAADHGQIDRISLINQVEQAEANEGSNLLVHPLANQRCPGDLCPEQTGSAEKLTIRLTPVGANYSYRFRILTSTLTSTDQIRVYARPLRDESVPCRVERASLTNYLARQSQVAQGLLLFAAVIILTFLVSLLKPLMGETK